MEKKKMTESEYLLKTVRRDAQRDALTDVFNTLMARSNKIDKVLFNPMYGEIEDGARGERYARLSKAWNNAFRKSKILMDLAGDTIEMKRKYL